MKTGTIHLSEYLYELPESQIARYPIKNRSDSRLLVCHAKTEHSTFRDIGKFLPDKAHLVFNNTQVLPARIRMEKDSGAQIEIFLTEPIAPYSDFQMIVNSKSPVTWKCLVGNSKRWKEGQILKRNWNGNLVECSWADKSKNHVTIKWDSMISFGDLLNNGGEMPLPPYMKREANDEDRSRYQTIYAKHKGAVAAPTAGLHFTKSLLKDLGQKHTLDYLTLHVSAGTFKPITEQDISNHEMHKEFVQITKDTVTSLLEAESIVAVGTTSLRTLESLYWFGVKLIHGDSHFFIEKLYPYADDTPQGISREQALEAVVQHMSDSGVEYLHGETEIFIFPGYKFKVIDSLITNFHLPGSTLILLVAALIGDRWKDVYREALEAGYRFLSYGDSSLLFKE